MRYPKNISQPNLRAETLFSGNKEPRAADSTFDFSRLASVRYLTVFIIAIGYASTMAIGPHAAEMFSHFGYDPSWIGVKILFFFSGVMALRSLQSGRYGMRYMRNRVMHIAPLLIVMTFISVALIFPIFGTANDDSASELLRYFILTVSCIDPGRTMPGLLDDAVYACLIQGAIWTLRWGLVLHIGCAVFGRFEILRRPIIILIAALSVTALYISLGYIVVKQDLTAAAPAITGLRLVYPFIIGMAVWAYRDHLPTRPAICGLWLALFMGIALLNYNFGPWSPIIEVSLSLFWGYAAWVVLTAKTKGLRSLENWPRLAAGLYFTIWPVTQIILMSVPTLSPVALTVISVPLAMIIGAGLQYALSLPLQSRRAVKS